MPLVTMVTVLMRSTCGHFQICVHFETNRCVNSSGKYLCVVLVTVCGISVHRDPNWSNVHWTKQHVRCLVQTKQLSHKFEEALNHWGI